MYNDLFSIGPFTVHGYGLMIAIGIIAAFTVAQWRAKRCGLNPDAVFDLGMWGTIGGFLGAKVLYWITILPDIVKDPKILLDLNSGWVVYGGIIMGIVSAWLYARRKKISFLAYFDLIMPEIALAQGFGRLGCFLAGCCYGIQTESPLGITFTHSDFAPNGVCLVSTQLISSAFNFLHFFLLVFWSKRGKKADGQVASLYLIIYSVGRFLVEFLRGDLARGSVGAVSTSQFISLFVFVVGIGLMVFFGKRGKAAKETPAVKEEAAEEEPAAEEKPAAEEAAEEENTASEDVTANASSEDQTDSEPEGPEEGKNPEKE